jgi:hypothetical protein
VLNVSILQFEFSIMKKYSVFLLSLLVFFSCVNDSIEQSESSDVLLEELAEEITEEPCSYSEEDDNTAKFSEMVEDIKNLKMNESEFENEINSIAGTGVVWEKLYS